MITELDKNTALVIIDLQKGIAAFPTVHPMNDIIDNAAKLVDAFHKAGKPVVFINVDPSRMMSSTTRKAAGGGASAANLPPEFLEIVPQLDKQPNDLLITKHTWSAFFETELHNELQKLGVTGIVLCGVATSIGVEGTARQAAEFEYNLAFATDAMTDMKADAHENSIQNIFPRIGELDVTENVIAKL